MIDGRYGLLEQCFRASSPKEFPQDEEVTMDRSGWKDAIIVCLALVGFLVMKDVFAQDSSAADAKSSQGEQAAWNAVKSGRVRFADVSSKKAKASIPLSEELSDRYALFRDQLLEKNAVDVARHRQNFIEGELAGMGNLDFVSSHHRIVIGFEVYPDEHWISGSVAERSLMMSMIPRVAFSFDNLFLSFELPLEFKLYNQERDMQSYERVGGTGFGEAGDFIGMRWKTAQEYTQLINYIVYGTKEESLYVNITSVAATSIGHGVVMERYNPNIELRNNHVGGEVDLGSRLAGLEFYSSDILSYDVISGLTYLRPLALLAPDHLFTRTLSFGAHYSQDRAAPYRMDVVASTPDVLFSDGEGGAAVSEYRMARIAGADVEAKFIRKGWVDLRGYVDYSRLLNTGGDGISLGALSRVSFLTPGMEQVIQAIRFRAEVGLYHPQYAPGYFDMFYEFQKYEALLGKDGMGGTKLQYLESQTGSYRPGGRLHATYAVVNAFAISAAIQGALGNRDTRFLLHLEVPSGDYLRLFVTYGRVNLLEPGKWFDLEDPNSLLIAKARLKVLPVVFLNAELSKMYHLTALDSNGYSTRALPSGEPIVFTNNLQWVLETEIGFEF